MSVFVSVVLSLCGIMSSVLVHFIKSGREIARVIFSSENRCTKKSVT